MTERDIGTGQLDFFDFGLEVDVRSRLEIIEQREGFVVARVAIQDIVDLERLPQSDEGLEAYSQRISEIEEYSEESPITLGILPDTNELRIASGISKVAALKLKGVESVDVRLEDGMSVDRYFDLLAEEIAEFNDSSYALKLFCMQEGWDLLENNDWDLDFKQIGIIGRRRRPKGFPDEEFALSYLNYFSEKFGNSLSSVSDMASLLGMLDYYLCMDIRINRSMGSVAPVLSHLNLKAAEGLSKSLEGRYEIQALLTELIQGSGTTDNLLNIAMVLRDMDDDEARAYILNNWNRLREDMSSEVEMANQLREITIEINSRKRDREGLGYEWGEVDRRLFAGCVAREIRIQAGRNTEDSRRELAMVRVLMNRYVRSARQGGRDELIGDIKWRGEIEFFGIEGTIFDLIDDLGVEISSEVTENVEELLLVEPNVYEKKGFGLEEKD